MLGRGQKSQQEDGACYSGNPGGQIWVARQKVLSLGQNEVAFSTGVVRLQGRGGWGREEEQRGGTD